MTCWLLCLSYIVAQCHEADRPSQDAASSDIPLQLGIRLSVRLLGPLSCSG